MRALARIAAALGALALAIAAGCTYATPKVPDDYDSAVAEPLTRRPLRVDLSATHRFVVRDEACRLGWYAAWRGNELLAEVRKVAPAASLAGGGGAAGERPLDLAIEIFHGVDSLGGQVLGLLTGYAPLATEIRFDLYLRERGILLARRSVDVTEHRHRFFPPPLFGIQTADLLGFLPRADGFLLDAPESLRKPEAQLCASALAEMLREVQGAAREPRAAKPPPAPAPDPEPVIALAAPREGLTTTEASVRLLASVAHPTGLGEVQLLVNDAPLAEGARGVGGVTRAPEGVREQAVDVVVPLAVGENRIRLIARSAKGRAVEVARTVRRNPAAGPAARCKWAVVVGVSRYRNAGAGFANLRFAAADARELARVLTTECGFDPARVRLLVDEDATSAAVRDALFGFLSRAIEEDLVVIYFAGHGGPEPTNPGNVYLLTHEADPARLASTAFPMWDVETALRRSVKAERVLVLADACRSAGIAGDVGTRGAGENAVNRHLAKLDEVGPGRAVFTASEAGELSQEGERWGGGHGAFTWHLVQALRGAADRDGDGVVTLGEMFDSVEEAVRRDTGSTQHPTRAGRYDRRLPLAAVAR